MPTEETTRGLNLPIGSAQKKVPDGKSIFLGIGIDEYKHFRSLSNAVKDVKDVEQLLRTQYDIEDSTLLINKAATRGNIISALDRIKKEIKPVDKILIYYSGHGHLDENKRGYWIPVDAQVDNTQNYIRNATIREFLEDIKAKHILVISDSCFSGRLATRSVAPPANSTKAIAEMNSYPSRWLLASGRHDQEVADGRPGTNSPFTSSILQYLKEYDGDFLNISQLAEYTTRATVHNYDQLPVGSPLFGVGHVDGGQYVFKKKNKELPFVPLKNPILPSTTKTSAQALPTKTPKKGLPKALFYILPLILIIGSYFIYQAIQSSGTNNPKASRTDNTLEIVDPKRNSLEEENLKDPDKDPNNTKTPSTEIRKEPTTPNRNIIDKETKEATFSFATIKAGSLYWTTKNQSKALNGSDCYNNAQACSKNGRLYTWTAAQKACAALGTGWRLPTESEWKDNYRALFSAQAMPLAGWSDAANGFYKGGSEGFYWTSTKGSHFRVGQSGQTRTARAPETNLYSCKCVRGK